MAAFIFRGSRIYLSITAAWIASNLVARQYGITFDDSSLGWFWQYLDPEILKHDLLRGIYYLHSQPPLFNLFLGFVLQLFPDSSHLAFAALLQAMALGLLLAMAWLMRRLAVPDLVNVALTTLFALHPTFLLYSNWLFYTLPVALIVTLGAVSLVRFGETEASFWANTFVWLAAALMLTRAIFHLLWLLLVLVGSALPLGRVARRRLLVAALAPLLVVSLWYAKNGLQVGAWGASSWLGMNLRRGWLLEPEKSPRRPQRPRAQYNVSQDEVRRLIDSGDVPELWVKSPFAIPAALRAYGYFRPLPPSDAGCHPAICALTKSNGKVNYNHRDYARVARDMLRGDVAVMRAFPDRYLDRVRQAFVQFMNPGPRIFFGRYDLGTVTDLRDAWSRAVVLNLPLTRDMRWSVNLLLVAYPALLAFGAWRALWGPRPERIAFTYMTFTVLWFALCANLIEIGENDRMRFETDPLLIVLLGCAVGSLVGWIGAGVRSMRTRSRSPLDRRRPWRSAARARGPMDARLAILLISQVSFLIGRALRKRTRRRDGDGTLRRVRFAAASR